MSYFEDFIADNLPFDADIKYMYVEEDAKKGIWTMRNGEKIHVSEMAESHINNAIKYIEKHDKNDIYLPWIHAFKKELERRKALNE